MNGLAGRWRLIEEGPAAGVRNMAEDIALVEGDGPLPVLRLFAWERPTLSLGYSQDADAVVDWRAAAAAGIPVVRRPSGGGAVLHDGAFEVTYSVVADERALPASVVDAYRVLAQALVAALRELGLVATLAVEVAPLAERGAVCFETPSRYELLVDGKKTVGSAQWRRHGRVLQHGAIPLRLDPERAVAALASRDRAALARRLAEHAQGLGDAAGRPIAAGEVRRALVAGFAAALGARFEAGGLTPAEEARREELVALGVVGPLTPGAGRGLTLGAVGSAGAVRMDAAARPAET
jgi:lipoate-protein ligase A